MRNKILIAILALAVTATQAQADKSAEAFSKSYTLEGTKDYKGAIAVLETVYQASSYEFNLRLGWLNYLKGDYTKSVEYYQKAIGLQPKSVEARLGAAYPIYALGNIEDLVKNYKDVLALDPVHYTVNTRLANIYYERKQYDNALVHLVRLQEQYPFDYTTNLLLGKVYVALGKITEAKRTYQSCVLYYPTEQEAISALKKLQ